MMLRDASARQDAKDLEVTLGLCFRFGVSAAHRELLRALAESTWPHSHEDVIFSLDNFRDPSLIDVFVRATQWLPEYMAWDDENRALARKAVYAISKIPGSKADEALSLFAELEHPGLRELALRKLRERAERP